MLPSPGPGLDLDVTVVRLDDRLGDRQPEPDALDGAHLGVLGPEEAGEQPVQVSACAMPMPVSLTAQDDLARRRR